MERMTMMFKPTDAQQAALNTLSQEQQDSASPNYHKWLTPEQFADRFGLSPNDVTQIVSWLQTQGFTVDEVARTRRWVSFTGVAHQVESAFQTTIHEYVVNGEAFYANTTDPLVPAALGGVVSGFRSLNNFRMKPRPRFTSSVTGNHYVTPADFATIYNLGGVYADGLDGAGQKIAIMGQTQIQVSDIRAFRSAAGLPASDPEIVLVPGSTDPGIVNGDVQEASLDIEWSGAVARNAQIVFVTSKNGVFDALQYAVDRNVAPVVSISYGSCEKNFTSQDAALMAAIGQQANAQGITIIASSGDTGAADCDTATSKIAARGLSVDIPASLPSVTALGGSQFREADASWGATNDSRFGSALSYIPEVAWNDTAATGVLTAGGGGRSIYFSKPGWQTGSGVPNDNARDIPDVSLNASGQHDGYLMCAMGSCVNGFRASNGGLTVVGGTSVGAPAFAGVIAIINQISNASQGNINPKLYALAASSPSAFHDITSGGNQVPCRAGTPDCASGGSIGYGAAAGYDLATGLGSVDVSNLIAVWVPRSVPAPAPTPAPDPAPVPVPAPAQPVTIVPSPTVPPTTAPLPISEIEQGTVRSGYAVITPDVNSAAPSPTVTFGMVSGGAVQSQAGILPLPMMTNASLFVDVVPAIGRDLGVAIANPAVIANSVTLTLRDQSGTVAGTPLTIVLKPQQQLAKFVSELLPGTTGSAFRGSLELQSSTPFAVLGLRFSGSEFSTLPVTGTAAAGTNTSIVLPQFAMSGGWATQFALVNNSSGQVNGRIDIFDNSGNPMSVTLNGAKQSTFSYTIPAGGTFLLAPRDQNGQSPF